MHGLSLEAKVPGAEWNGKSRVTIVDFASAFKDSAYRSAAEGIVAAARNCSDGQRGGSAMTAAPSNADTK